MTPSFLRSTTAYPAILRPTYFHPPAALTTLVCLCCLLFAIQPAQATDKNKVLILGDSLSAGYGIEVEDGWVNLLAQRLAKHQPNWQAINASISGNTSGDGLARLSKLLQVHEPEIVVLELGGNDGLRGHPLKRMRANLGQIIEQSRAASAQVLMLGIAIPPNYGRRYTDEFRRSLAQVASQYEVAFVPFVLEKIALEPELMQNDGIHPTAEAQPILLDTVWPDLKALLDKH